MRFILGCLIVLGASGPLVGAAYAADWGNVVQVSSTMGVNGGRICIGEDSRGDIGCPTYAPSLTTAGDVSVTGNLSAAAFIGDGSGLTGIAAGAVDRLVSGTQEVVANGGSGYVSLSTAGTDWGYLGTVASYLPRLNAGGISITTGHGISSTNGYFSGSLGVGTGAPAYPLDISGTVNLGGSGNSTLRLNHVYHYIEKSGTSNNYYASGYHLMNGTSGIIARFGVTNLTTNFYGGLTVGSGYVAMTPPAQGAIIQGNVGIGTTAPAATLQVSGSMIVSVTGQTTTPSLYVGTNGNVGVGTSSPDTNLVVQRNTTSSGNGLAVKTSAGNTLFRVYEQAGSGGMISVFDHADSEKVRLSGLSHSYIHVPGLNFGIGTVSPNAKLDVIGLISSTNIYSGAASFTTLTVGGVAVTGASVGINDLTDGVKNSTDNNLFLGHEGGSVGANDDRNIALGITALTSLNNSTGTDNVAVGPAALQDNVSGDGNVAVGSSALDDATLLYNTAVGYQAGMSTASTTISDNVSLFGGFAGMGANADSLVAVGYQSGYLTSGTNVTLVGGLSGYQNSATNVTAVGYSSGYQNTGADSTAVGHTSGWQNSGANVTAVGYSSAYLNTGANGTFVGYETGQDNSSTNVSSFGYRALRYRSASNTTALGYEAGRGADTTRTGFSNAVLVGYQAGYSNTTGADQNTLVGYLAGYGMTSGASNTVVGNFSTTGGITTGSNNILIGADVRPASATANNQLNIGNTIFATGLGVGASVPTASMVGIGTNAPSYALHVANGQVAGAGAYVNTSDRRLKKNIAPLGYNLATLMQLEPVEFDWVDQSAAWQKKHQVGLIAQDVEKIVPEAVSVAGDKSKTMSIAYSALVPILIESVQELKRENDRLRAEFEEFKRARK